MGTILLGLLMLATMGVLVAGIIIMVRGGKTNEKYGNKMMVWRVSLQAAAIAMMGLLFLTS